MSYLVSQQTREMGVRLALGATTGGVVGLVLRRGVTLALVGTAIGLALAAVMGRFLTALLFEVRATDLATFVAAPALLVAVAALASFWPARRASRVDPAVVLRGD